MDVTFPSRTFRAAVAINTVNGTEQDLVIEAADGGVRLRGVILRDWPLLLRLIP